MTARTDDGRFYWQANMEDENRNVRRAETPEERNNPDFYGVYERLEDGTSLCLADFWAQADAEMCLGAVRSVHERHVAKASSARVVA